MFFLSKIGALFLSRHCATVSYGRSIPHSSACGRLASCRYCHALAMPRHSAATLQPLQWPQHHIGKTVPPGGARRPSPLWARHVQLHCSLGHGGVGELGFGNVTNATVCTGMCEQHADVCKGVSVTVLRRGGSCLCAHGCASVSAASMSQGAQAMEHTTHMSSALHRCLREQARSRGATCSSFVVDDLRPSLGAYNEQSIMRREPCREPPARSPGPTPHPPERRRVGVARPAKCLRGSASG